MKQTEKLEDRQENKTERLKTTETTGTVNKTYRTPYRLTNCHVQ